MMKQLLVLALALVAVQATVLDEAEHDADTPTRQAQRAMLAERETATAKHASEDVLGMRLQAVYPERNHGEARRISGAAQSFHPDDRMCVMCQFLAQRISLDLVGGVGGAAGAPYAGSGMPPYAMISAVSLPASANAFVETATGDELEAEESDLVEIDVDADEEADEEAEAEDAAFIQVADEEEAEDEAEDEAEAEEETEDEDEEEADEESEEEAEDESEEEEEDSEEEETEEALIEVKSDDSGEWTTPEFSNSAVAAAPSPAALLETAADDFQTPQYIDAVYQTVEGENSAAETEEETAEAEAGTTDVSEPSFFESAALASTKVTDGEWTTPEFTAEPKAKAVETVTAELTAFVQTEETSEDGWSTPTYTDAAAAPSGNKAYARVIGVANSEEQSLIEAVSTTAASDSVQFVKPRMIRSRASRRGGKLIDRFRTPGPDIFHTAKRYRSADAIVPRPRWDRYAPHSPRHMANRLIAGMALRNAEHNAYDRLEAYCSTRLPESYGKYCRPVLRKFRRITEGLSYGDKVPRVCMNVNLCKKTSYVVNNVHDKLEERTF